MHRGRSLDVIVSAEISRAPWERMVEPERYGVASLVAELVDAFCEPEMALADIYELLTGALEAIARSNAPRALLPRFSLRLLEMLGIGAAALRLRALRRAAARGARLARCRGRRRESIGAVASAGAICRSSKAATSRTCAHWPVRATMARRFTRRRRAAAAVEELVAHHLGRRPKASAHLDSAGSLAPR